jgi:LuxR family maltose regulon positive regulatory protein
MTETLLTIKYFIPAARSKQVSRPRLIAKLNDGLHRKLTLISAPAGFGKTTLVVDWLEDLEARNAVETQSNVKFAWLSLDESDNDQPRFLLYFISSLVHHGVIGATVGEDLMRMLQSSPAAPINSILIKLINALSAASQKIMFVLDDYHLIELQSIHDALNFLIRNMNPQLHLVIVTREDPQLSQAKLRAKDQLTEVRAADLRFTPDEASEYLGNVMGLDLEPEEIITLDCRTEGWITGLQLAAISLQGRKDTSALINSFSGTHRYVVDYLIEEVLDQQPEATREFLLQTSILAQLTGSLCDAVTSKMNSQHTLESLEKSNLFIIPLDNDRHWYRYHHLFADLLGTRLQRQETAGSKDVAVEELHISASKWYEENGMDVEAFHHAALANDYDRAERLIEGEGLPISFRGIVSPVLYWFDSLPESIFISRPSLWVTYAMTLLTIGQVGQAEEKLLAAENALKDARDNELNKDLVGRIACIRANMAVGSKDIGILLEQLDSAFENLDPKNLTYRSAATWNLGVAFEFQGKREAAREAFSEALKDSEFSGNIYIQALASTGLANIQLAQNQLKEAEKSYWRVLDLVGDLPIPVGVHIHYCLGKIYYEWNKLDLARIHADECLILAEPFKEQNDTFYACRLLLAKLNFTEGDIAGAQRLVDEVEQSISKMNFPILIQEFVETRVSWLVISGDIEGAAELAEKSNDNRTKIRNLIARGKNLRAIAMLDADFKMAVGSDLRDDMLKALVLLSIAHNAEGDHDKALRVLDEGLSMAKTGGFIRTFVDEGPQMAELLYSLYSGGKKTEYIQTVLAAFPIEESSTMPREVGGEWIEPLSNRELEVLQLIAEGLTNQEVGSKLFLSLNTVKVHTRNIFSKLRVNNRTQAVSKARALGLLN